MSTRLRRLLFLPDCHIPYHDKRAWALMLQAATGFKPDTIIIMGDLVDFYSVSNYSKDPKRANKLPQEVAAVNKALDQLDCLKATDKRYIGGNHERRLETYLRDKAPELFNYINVADLLHLGERGYKYTPYLQHDRIGKLWLSHDVGTAGRYSVFRASEAFSHSVVTAHTHRQQYIVEGNATGDARVSAIFGWLGDAQQVDYLTKIKAIKDWSLGFGIGYLNEKTGLVYVLPVPIVNNTCVVEGRLYQ